MKVALLVCDHVRDDLVAAHGDYPKMFQKLLPRLPMDSWFVCDGQFPDINDYDAFVCTGSKHSVYEKIEWIDDLSQFTRGVFRAGKKFVGSCFGHQMMAHALGGVVNKSAHGYLIGVHTFQISERLPWIEEDVSTFNVLMLCQDQVAELPSNSKVWASSSTCPIGIFTIGSNFLGIQGHPEFTKAYNQAVFERRPERISTEKMEAAKQSFASSPDTAFLSHLLTEFINA